MKCIVKWEDGKRKLILHKETAGVVKDIYEMYLSGKGFKQIVKVLYARKINRPAIYRRTGHVFCQDGELLEQWGSATVKLILSIWDIVTIYRRLLLVKVLFFG